MIIIYNLERRSYRTVKPEGYQHKEENDGPYRGSRHRGQRLRVRHEHKPRPWWGITSNRNLS